MPLDPSIITSLQPVHIQTPNPLDFVKTLAGVEDVRAQVEQRRLAADAARQKAMDDAAVRQVLTQTGGDVEAAIPLLYQRAPGPAAALSKEWEDIKQKRVATAKTNLEVTKQKLEIGANLAQMITDQPSQDFILPMIAAHSPDVAQLIGPTYDPQKIAGLNEMIKTAQQRTTGRLEAVKLWTDGKPQESLHTALATIDPAAPDASAQWDQVLKTYRSMGAPPDVLASAGDFSPENQARATRAAIGPTKEAELAGQEAARKATEAHQITQENLTAAAQKIAAGQLGVAQARERREAATPELVQVLQDGKPVWVPKAQAVGQPAAGGAAGRPPTGVENKALAFYNRGKDALDTLTTPDATGKTLEDKVSGVETSLGRVPVVGNYLISSDAQAYTQAQRAFTEARLRSEAGARIPETAYENDRKTYFKQPGDSDAVVAQKRRARETVLNGLAGESGKAYEAYYGTPFTPDTGKTPGGAPASVPAPVSAALKTVGPGRHTLSDGTVWDKRPDGSIVKAQ